MTSYYSRRRYRLNLPKIKKTCQCGCGQKFETITKRTRYIRGHFQNILHKKRTPRFKKQENATKIWAS